MIQYLKTWQDNDMSGDQSLFEMKFATFDTIEELVENGRQDDEVIYLVAPVPEGFDTQLAEAAKQLDLKQKQENDAISDQEAKVKEEQEKLDELRGS